MSKIYEWCPLCEEEVEIEEKFEVQICPNCGKPILPCGVLESCSNMCGKCPLEDELAEMAKALN